MQGHVYKRCKCPVLRDASGRRLTCPKPHGSWAWVADVTQPGGPRQQQTRAGYRTRKDAEQALRAFLGDLDKGLVSPPSKTTVAEYLADWLEQVTPTLAVTAATNYAVMLRLYLVPHLGEVRLTALDPARIMRTYRTLLQSGGRGGRPLSPTTVRTAHRILSKALSDAVRQDLLARNPAQRVSPPRPVKAELQVWSRAEAMTFLAAIGEDRLQAAWLLALLCGLRRGELAGLRWRDLDLEEGRLRVAVQRTTDAAWQVVDKEPKGTSRRTIDLGPLVVRALSAHRQRADVERELVGGTYGASGLVFVAEDGRPYHPDRFRELFQQAAVHAQVPVIRLHDARHSCATLALEAGVHPKVVQQLLGHSSWAVTMDLYSHRVDRLQRDAALRIEELVQPDDGPASG